MNDNYTIPPTDWTVAALRHVEFWSVRIQAAALELARRYTTYATGVSGKSEHYREQVAAEWLKGWKGEPSPYAYGRGGNFAIPFRRAHLDGKQRRAEIEKAVAE